MSVMAETHQSAMGPYFAMAEAAFELNSVTAVFREALLGKVSTMQAGVGSEGEVEGGGGDGCGDDGGGGRRQQASLQFAVSLFFFLSHNFMHFFGFCFFPLHNLVTFFQSFFLHVFFCRRARRSLSATERW